jgi:DNA-binding PadR family transcriptional regulator
MKLFAASRLPEIEYEVLDCLSTEKEEPMTAADLQSFESLDCYQPTEIVSALHRLCDQGMVSRLYPEGTKFVLTKYGRDVIEFASNTERDE